MVSQAITRFLLWLTQPSQVNKLGKSIWRTRIQKSGETSVLGDVQEQPDHGAGQPSLIVLH